VRKRSKARDVTRRTRSATPAQAERARLMALKGITVTTLTDALNADGIKISRQAISDVVTRGRYVLGIRLPKGRTETIKAKFCELTGTTLLQAWPDHVNEGDDESDPAVIDRINRARGVTASGAEQLAEAAGD
jgi:hypothetical protein